MDPKGCQRDVLVPSVVREEFDDQCPRGTENEVVEPSPVRTNHNASLLEEADVFLEVMIFAMVEHYQFLTPTLTLKGVPDSG